MRRRVPIFLTLLFVAGFGVGLLAPVLPAFACKCPGWCKGQAMPDATFLATYGDTIRLQELTNGRKSVLIFLSTTCTPCADLAAEWRNVFPDYGSSYELIGVSSEPAAVVEQFAGKWGIPFPIILDSDGRFGREYHIEASPTVLGINESGMIAFAEIGYVKGQGEAIQDLLHRF